MTEEIINDGVDVAGCCLYLKDNGKCLRLLTDNEPETECNAICDYGCLYHKEQLKRLEQENKQMKSALEEIRDLCIHYENTNDKCVTNCYAHFIVTDLIQTKINEVLQ